MAVQLTCRPHISRLGPADSKSSHCEQTDRHRPKLWYSRAGNYRIIKHFWVNSFVDSKRRCQVSVIEARVGMPTALYKDRCSGWLPGFHREVPGLVPGQPCGICGRQRGNRTSFPPINFVFLCYHSTDVSYSVSHLRMTLYNLNQFTVSLNKTQGKIDIACLFLSQN